MKTLAKLVLFAVLVVILLVAGLLSFRTAPEPALTLETDRPAIGRRTGVKVVADGNGRGLSAVKLELVQGDKATVLAEKTAVPRPVWAFWGPRTLRAELEATAGKEAVPTLVGGEAVLRATAERAGTWLRRPAPVVKELKLPVRLQPPSLALQSSQHYLTQGGSEVVLYKVGATSVRDGVRAGEAFFAGHALPGGQPDDRFALFAAPYDLPDSSGVRLVAEDEVGNQAQVEFVDRYFPKPFAADTIQLDDRFMNKVVPEILAQTPELQDKGDLLQNYLQINNDLRKKNAEALVELGRRSRAEFLWKEPFLPMPNGQVMSSFADRRVYVYQGQEVDHQTHLGFDLAAVQRAPVPASNHGVVALAKYFGIYGNTVVVDHGFGLQSLYAHLSSIDVTEGQEVERGQTVGKTGATGLAGGDHLHFTMLLHGVPVNPNEWWDAHWINDRLKRKLGTALAYEAVETPRPGRGKR